MKKIKKKFERGQQKSRHPPHRGAPVVHFPHFAPASLKTAKNGLYGDYMVLLMLCDGFIIFAYEGATTTAV